MKVLIIDAFSGSRSGRQAFMKFDKVVRSAFETVERHEQGRTEFVVRHFRKGLEDLCYDNEEAGLSSKTAIAALDKLDVVFIDGDSRVLPWHPRAHKLVIFLRTVIGARKCLFAAGPGAHVVAYVCATGGKALSVLNGGGDGGSLLDLCSLRPEDLGGTGKPKCGGKALEVALDSTTGDFYAFDSKTDRWIAEGNVGIQKNQAGVGGTFAAILADASEGLGLKGYNCAIKVPTNKLLGVKRESQSAADISSTTLLQRPNTPRVQSEVLIRVRPKHVQHRFLRSVPCGEFLAWSPGKWGIGEATATRCRKTFSVLASSNRAGPEVVEIDNCVATRFNIRDGYPHSLELLRAFVEEKHGLIRDGNRIDRRSDFVVSGFQTGDDFDGMSVRSSHKHTAGGTISPEETLKRRRASTRRPSQNGNKDAMASRRTSSKRTAPFPRRPKPVEKPRLAPPHSTRTIRASATVSADGGDDGCGGCGGDVANERGGGGSVTARGAFDDETATMLPSHHHNTRAPFGVVHNPGTLRGADPAGRRRVLIARVGEGMGVDLSPAIDAVLQAEENKGVAQKENDYRSHTTRTAPAACGHTPMPRNVVDPASFFSNVNEDVREQGSPDEHKLRDGRGACEVVEGGEGDEHQCRQKVDGDGDHFGSIEGGSGGRESRCRFTKEHDPSIPTSRSIARGFRSERGMQRGGDPRRPDPPTKPLIRVPGHERRRPYSTFHRFKKMEQETRKVFFSLSCHGTDAGDNHGSRGTAESSCAEVGAGPENGAGAPPAHGRGWKGAGAGDDENNKTRFSANFGRKEAWTSTPEPTLRTQGPYLGKNGCTSQGAQVGACRSWINPKRWAFSGVKTPGWAGIGEGTGARKGV